MENRFNQLQAPPVFIVGAARSGTTWVFDIFKSHPLVASVYESWLFTPNNGLKVLVGDAHYPKKGSGLGRLVEHEIMIDHIREMAQSIMSYAIQDEHRYIVEKSPNHIFHHAFIREIFPDAKFIHVKRDGRDVCVSVNAAANSWMPNWKNSFGKSIRTQATSWKHVIQRADELRTSLGDDFLEVRYEELHDNPKAGYKQMFDFAGIPYDDTILDMIFQKTDFETNYKGGNDKFRRGGRVGDWKIQLSLLDKLRFHRAAWNELIQQNYETDKRWWLRRS